MISKNILFSSFDKKKKLKKNANKIFKKIKWTNQYPLLESFTENYKYNYKKSLIKKYIKSKKIRVIGMGGSSLGTKSIYSFLRKKIKKKIIFVDNLTPNLIKENNCTNVVISKSGGTLETISNYHVLSKEKGNKFIFITEKKNNSLRKIAEDIKAEIVDHKNYIGGRFSVLSEVGMLPAELMGLKEKKFKKLNYLIKNKNFVKSLLLNVDQTLSLVKNGKFNSIILNYDEKSENLFKWYQQLIAESLGKKSKGIIPFISTMPKDNHSLLQLYLDGPKKSFYTFFNVKNNSSSLISKAKFYPIIGNKYLSDIISSQELATKNIFSKKKIPYREITVLKRNEESLGELFCFFVLETILLGRALKVNTFDQPSVEMIKKETKKILS